MWWGFAGTGAGATTALIPPVGFFGGRPRLRSGPCNASIARFSLSRSAMSKASMCSVGIRGHVITDTATSAPLP